MKNVSRVSRPRTVGSLRCVVENLCSVGSLHVPQTFSPPAEDAARVQGLRAVTYTIIIDGGWDGTGVNPLFRPPRPKETAGPLIKFIHSFPSKVRPPQPRFDPAIWVFWTKETEVTAGLGLESSRIDFYKAKYNSNSKEAHTRSAVYFSPSLSARMSSQSCTRAQTAQHRYTTTENIYYTHMNTCRQLL